MNCSRKYLSLLLHVAGIGWSVLFRLTFLAFPVSPQNLMPIRQVAVNSSKSVTLPQNDRPVSGRFVSVALSVAEPARAIPTPPSWFHPVAYVGPSPASLLGNAVYVSQTPFDQQYEMALGSFLHGRIRLDGLGTVSAMDTFLRGLPGSGNLLGRFAAPTGHPGVSAPSVNNTYGFSISLHHATTDDGPSALSYALRLGSLFRR